MGGVRVKVLRRFEEEVSTPRHRHPTQSSIHHWVQHQVWPQFLDSDRRFYDMLLLERFGVFLVTYQVRTALATVDSFARRQDRLIAAHTVTRRSNYSRTCRWLFRTLRFWMMPTGSNWAKSSGKRWVDGCASMAVWVSRANCTD